jgi:hypothetical protein
MEPFGLDPGVQVPLAANAQAIGRIVWEYTDRSLSAAPGGAVGPDAVGCDADIYLSALVGGTARCCAKVILWNGIYARPSDIARVTYSVFRLGQAAQRKAVDGHTAVAIKPEECLLEQLESDARASAYNFMYVLDISTRPAFTSAGEYLVEFQLMPLTGQLILVRFRINVI